MKKEYNLISQQYAYFVYQQFFFDMILKIIIVISLIVIGNSLQVEEKEKDHPILPYHTLPVYGNASLGYYFVKIYLGGDETQSQSVIIDTGSGILAVPCTKCHDCSQSHIDPPYDPEKSKYSTFLTCQSENSYCQKECREISDKNSNCPFAIHYAEGSSLQGIMIADKIAFENYSRGEEINTFFGCTTKETNLFLSQEANGIFGLAPNRQSDLLDQMVAKYHKYSGQTLQFSLCLSSNGGLMTLGGLNTDLHGEYSEPSAVGKFNSSKNLYSLEGMHQIRIGQQVLHWGPKNYGPHGIFIDSGSTYTYFPKQTYNKFQKYLNNICIESKKCYLSRGDKEMCYDLQKQGKTLLEATKELFPPLFFQLNKKDIVWPSTKYMLMDDEQGSLVCLGVRRLDRFLLGGTWMYDRDIVFDIKNSTISIYDNVKCVKDAPEMGRKSKNLEAIDEIQQSSSQSLSNILFFVGVFFTICSIIGVALLISTRLKKSKSVQFTELAIKENENHRQGNEQRRTNGLIDQDHEEQILNSQNS